jgi:cellulose synthase/poly-beta-1,6-N-acetylglucosamine synthase-like glycosyltransferase
MEGRVNGQGASALLVELTEALGKAGAIRAGAQQCPGVDLYVVFDADSAPRPDCLQWLAGAFEDATLGAVGGYPEPGNSNESIVARYAALERWVHHLVTLAGKDRLGANPYANGAVCAFRREAVEAMGGFPADGIVEDVQISLALNRAGWRTRSIRQARAREDVVSTLSGFLLQRERWSRGLMDSTPRARGLEDLLVVSGYLDRVILVACAAGALAGWLSPWWFAGYLAAPVSSIALAAWRAGVRNPLPYCFAVLAMFPVDIAASFNSVVHQIGAAPKRWNPHRDRHGASGVGADRAGSITSADD